MSALLQRQHQTKLVFRQHAGKYIVVQSALFDGFLKLFRRAHACADTHFFSHRACRGWTIAGNHQHPHSQIVQILDQHSGVFPWRILQCHQSCKLQSVAAGFDGNGQDARTVRPQFFHVRADVDSIHDQPANHARCSLEYAQFIVALVILRFRTFGLRVERNKAQAPRQLGQQAACLGGIQNGQIDRVLCRMVAGERSPIQQIIVVIGCV